MEQKPGLLNRKWVRAMLYIASALLLLCGVFLLVREHVLLPDPDFVMPQTPAPTPEPTPSPTPAPDETPVPTPSPTPYVRPIPTRISFPAAKQSCEVFPSGVLENGQMEVIDRADAASWLENAFGYPRPAPGEEGNAIIAGHKSKDGVAGTFKVLWDAKPGDAVVIDYEDGTQGWFYIHSLTRYPYQALPASVMSADADSPQLTLITCIGEWDSDGGTSSERLVAVCRPEPLESQEPAA